jgi:hypothetical protein
VFFDFPNHLAVGVWGGAHETGTYVHVGGRRYFYCESTGTGFSFGEAPDEYESASVDVVLFW